MWKDYPGIGHFTISTNGDPKDAAKISDTVDAVIAEFIAKPMNADLFERARKPTLESYRDWRKKNSTWFNLVKLAQTEPIELERFQQNEDLFRSITAEDIWKAAQRFLKDQKPFTFRSLPEKSAGDVSVSATATGANGATPLSDSRK
jgi:zinc protease